MNRNNKKFWPFGRQFSIAWSIVIFIVLVLSLFKLKQDFYLDIKSQIDATEFIVIALVSLLPVILAVLDVIVERGVIQYGDIKIDFSQVSQFDFSGLTLPENIGEPTQPLNSSSVVGIITALEDATTCDIVVIDLKDGSSWWDTRLLVLLAGAVRLGRPAKIVFIGKSGAGDSYFQGWGYPNKMLPSLLKYSPQYKRTYYATQSAARQWELVGPWYPENPDNLSQTPTQPKWMQGELAKTKHNMAFDGSNGLPNTLFAEQLLASELGEKVEKNNQQQKLNILNVKHIFPNVLYDVFIDMDWPTERQVSEFFSSDIDHVAITQNGKFDRLIPRVSILNSYLGEVSKKQ